MMTIESKQARNKRISKQILKTHAWIIGISIVIIIIIQIIGGLWSSRTVQQDEAFKPEQKNELLTNGTEDVFRDENSLYLVTGLAILSMQSIKAILTQICEAAATDKWNGYETT